MAALIQEYKKGSTSRQVTLRLAATDGSPLESATYATVTLWYRREGAAKVAITTVALAALTTAYTSGGFLHIDDGEYRLDVPDLGFATGVNGVVIGGAVTGGVVFGGLVKLVDYDPESATVTLTAAGLQTDAVTKIVTGVMTKAASAAYNSRTFEERINVIYAAEIAGNVTGAAGVAFVIRNPANTADVVTGTMDANGNRSSITVTP